MAYATVLDVHQLNTGRATYTATSKPSDTQVISYLELTGGEIDGILRSRGLTVPVPTTATGALKLLEHGNALGGACLVEQGAQVSDRRPEALHLWEEFKKQLSSGLLDVDLAADTDTGTPRHGAIGTAMFAATYTW